MSSGALNQLAALHGVQLSYFDISGREWHAEPDTLVSVLRSLGTPLQDAAEADAVLAERSDLEPVLEPVLVAWDGWLHDFRLNTSADPATVHYQLHLEDGEVRAGPLNAWFAHDGLRARLDDALPFGYHHLTVECGRERAEARIIAAPTIAHASRSGTQREWGLFLPLYALRARGNQGIGDYTRLGELMRWTGRLGGAYVGTLPLLATFLHEPFEPSPYSPISRLFWSDVFLDVRAAARVVGPHHELHLDEDFNAALEPLNHGDLVDYGEVARLKRKAIEPIARCFFQNEGADRPEFRAFERDYPRVRDFAAFRATCDQHRTGWSAWPEPLRSGQLSPFDYDPGSAEYHLFAQFAASRQLESLSSQDGAQLYLDLPLGVHPDGYDVWRERDLFATGVSTGAPPDAFFTQGQNWGFPPINPGALRAQRYDYLRDAIRTHLRYASALRLDHVMALHRLFWVPNGMPASHGVYVRYPANELYALLCLESHRHRALIVGEDLGTVPPEVRDEMGRHEIARMYVVQFEAHADSNESLPPPPAHAVVSLNTHDMPSFEAFRRGLDADLRSELHLMHEDEVAAVRHARRELIHALVGQLEQNGFLHGPAEPEQVRDALLAFLAASPARLLLVNLEDLWREERPQNIPGTGLERPNWRRRARPALEEIMNSPDITAVLNRLDRIRRET